jgi:hypothetical protein
LCVSDSSTFGNQPAGTFGICHLSFSVRRGKKTGSEQTDRASWLQTTRAVNGNSLGRAP